MTQQQILPGQTVGILGGGQLGRMFGIAARRMGYRVHSFDPTRDCPAGQVADVEVNAPYDDVESALHFASNVSVVTFEFENIPSETLAAINSIKPVYPSPKVLQICQHRLREKDFLRQQGFPIADYQVVKNPDELRLAIHKIGLPCILKTADFGYDGKGQVRIEKEDQCEEAWNQMNRPVGVLETFIPFSKEISVICARNYSGNQICFPPAENDHRNHILDVTTVPANISQRTLREAIAIARGVTNSLEVVGLLAVEMFVLGEGDLKVNELAPRPHNSGHFSFDACVTSQFEQQLRAVCGLPLGNVDLLRPVAMANLLGDLWQDGEPRWPEVLTNPFVKLHLYGKREPRPGRKMGHLTAMADSPAEAKEIVIKARESLRSW